MFVAKSRYVGIDESSKYADKIADLGGDTSEIDCIFMRHLLEHNFDWRRTLTNAIASFKKRKVLVILIPLDQTTRQIATSTILTSVSVPDISFRKEDLARHIIRASFSQERMVYHREAGIISASFGPLPTGTTCWAYNPQWHD